MAKHVVTANKAMPEKKKQTRGTHMHMVCTWVQSHDTDIQYTVHPQSGIMWEPTWLKR